MASSSAARIAARILLAAGLAAGIGRAQAQAQESARAYDIPAGPLAEALNRFAQQSGVSISMDASRVQGLRTPGLQGSYGVEEGFGLLLHGSGHAIARTSAGYVLVPAPGQGAGDAVTLPVLSVTGAGETATGPVVGYVARRSAVGTKTDTPILETPQSISIVTRDELDARGVTRMTEALHYVPGVLAEPYGNDDRSYDWFFIRGFDANYTSSFLDGLRQQSFGYIKPRTETYGLERLEVLRGPSSMLFGQGDAGGIVNGVSKRPQREAIREISVQLGNFGRKQVTADLGGGTEDGTLLYRLVGVGLDTDTQTRYGDDDRGGNERAYVAASVTWQPTPDTSFTLLTSFLRNRTDGGESAEYLGPDLQRTGVQYNDLSFTRFSQRQYNIGYELGHRLGPDWSVQQNLRLADVSVDYDFLYNLGFADAAGNLERGAYAYREKLRYLAVDNQLKGDVRTGPLQHRLLFGLDWMRSHYDNRYSFGAAPSLNIFNPVYGQAVTMPTDAFSDAEQVQTQLGLYAQDQIAFEGWRLTLGGRFDRAEGETDDRLTGTSTRTRDNAFTGRIGLTYLTESGLAPYVSYAESFLPQAGRDAAGDPFDPTRSRQYEVGVKYQPPGTGMLLTAAIFDLTKQNLLTPDPANPALFNVQTGEIRSRGLELEAKATLARGLSLTAQYTFNDVEVTKSNGADLGKQPILIPRHSASVWIDYTLPQGELEGLGFGAGARYMGPRYADAANTLSDPAYTLVDASIHYDRGAWRSSINIHNLLNKDYVATRAYNTYYPGTSRTIIGNLAYRF